MSPGRPLPRGRKRPCPQHRDLRSGGADRKRSPSVRPGGRPGLRPDDRRDHRGSRDGDLLPVESFPSPARSCVRRSSSPCRTAWLGRDRRRSALRAPRGPALRITTARACPRRPLEQRRTRGLRSTRARLVARERQLPWLLLGLLRNDEPARDLDLRGGRRELLSPRRVGGRNDVLLAGHRAKPVRGDGEPGRDLLHAQPRLGTQIGPGDRARRTRHRHGVRPGTGATSRLVRETGDIVSISPLTLEVVRRRRMLGGVGALEMSSSGRFLLVALTDTRSVAVWDQDDDSVRSFDVSAIGFPQDLAEATPGEFYAIGQGLVMISLPEGETAEPRLDLQISSCQPSLIASVDGRFLFASECSGWLHKLDLSTPPIEIVERRFDASGMSDDSHSVTMVPVFTSGAVRSSAPGPFEICPPSVVASPRSVTTTMSSTWRATRGRSTPTRRRPID